MQKRFIFRKEYFGYIKYCISSMTHEYVKEIDEPNENIKDIIELESSKYVNDGLLISPIRVYIETTLKCNLKCSYCFNIVGQHPDLSTNEMYKAIDEFNQNGVIDLRFTGGEITQRADWYEILEYAKQKGFIFSVNTNGAYKSNKIIQQFLSLKPNQITFSVDGIGINHDNVRGNGSFSKLINNMKILKQNGLNLRINTALSKTNTKYIDDILGLAEEYCTEVNFFGIRNIGEGINFKDSLNFDEFFEVFNYLSQKKIKGLNILCGHNIMKQMSVNENEFGLVVGSPDFTTRFNITSNGDYQAGGYLAYVSSQLELGNVLKNSLFDVWHNNEKLKLLRGLSTKLKNICYKCGYYEKKCNGGIFEMELQRHFNNIANPYCAYNLDFIPNDYI